MCIYIYIMYIYIYICIMYIYIYINIMYIYIMYIFWLGHKEAKSAAAIACNSMGALTLNHNSTPLAKSGPYALPNSVQISGQHSSRNCEETRALSVSSGASWLIAWRIPLARAKQSPGGYSFNLAVAQWPASSRPMDMPLGRSLVIMPSWSSL